MREPTGDDVVIIGGGIGGLAAGIYLQMNGYRTRILEKCGECGGVSVAWQRGEYLFDGATNWLAGSSAGAPLIHRILGEVVDFKDLQWAEFNQFMQIEHRGEIFHVYARLAQLREEMYRLAPQDGAVIEHFINAIAEFADLDVPFDKAPDLLSFGEKLQFPLRYQRLLRFSARWNRVSIAHFAARFSNPLMREMVTMILPHHSFFSILSLFAPLAWMHRGSCGTPLGGSRHFAALLERRYRQLGGSIHLNTVASKICFEGTRADSVLCANEQHYKARRIISAADRYHTHVKLLEGRFLKGRELDYFTRRRPFPSLVQVSLGVNRSCAEEPHKVVLGLAQPLRMGEEVVEQMLLRICNHDASFAPAGKTALIAHLRTTDVNYWTTLRSSDRAAYKQEKQRILRSVIESLGQRFSGIEEQIEVSDIATPATYIRYNNLWQGSYQSWAPTPGFAGTTLPRTLKGVPNFFFTGQWLSPAGGLPRAIVMGRQLAQRICAHDGRAFIHSN